MVRVRPRTKLKLKRKSRRCSKCGAKLNNQQIRCKKCAHETSLVGVGPGTRKGHFAKAYRRRKKVKAE
jgi:hypothetical protein